MELTDRVAVITGGGGGIGAATVPRLRGGRCPACGGGRPRRHRRRHGGRPRSGGVPGSWTPPMPEPWQRWLPRLSPSTVRSMCSAPMPGSPSPGASTRRSKPGNAAGMSTSCRRCTRPQRCCPACWPGARATSCSLPQRPASRPASTRLPTRSPSTPRWRWPSGWPSPTATGAFGCRVWPRSSSTPRWAGPPGTTPAAAAWVESIMIDPDEVAASVVEGLRDERFLILPHPEVARYFQNKATDYDRWLEAMRKLRAGFEG